MAQEAQIEHKLGKDFYVIFSEPQVDREKMLEKMPEHIDYQYANEEKGILFGAGPLFDAEGPPVMGMIIVRANSFEEAKKIADADPMHQAGYRKYTIRRWQLNEGSYSVTVKYSKQTMSID